MPAVAVQPPWHSSPSHSRKDRQESTPEPSDFGVDYFRVIEHRLRLLPQRVNASIVPIVDTRRLELWVEDAAVASTYLLLAAEHVGVGACWIHMRGRRGHTRMADDDIRALLGVPSHYCILNVVSLGVRKDPPEERHVAPIVHAEQY